MGWFCEAVTQIGESGWGALARLSKPTRKSERGGKLAASGGVAGMLLFSAGLWFRVGADPHLPSWRSRETLAFKRERLRGRLNIA